MFRGLRYSEARICDLFADRKNQSSTGTRDHSSKRDLLSAAERGEMAANLSGGGFSIYLAKDDYQDHAVVGGQ